MMEIKARRFSANQGSRLNILWRLGAVAITTAQLHSTRPSLADKVLYLEYCDRYNISVSQRN